MTLDDARLAKAKLAPIYLTLRWFLAGGRQGTHSTKTRGQVSGGGKKPWKQKGTGRARVGSIRSPLWHGGGIVFGPKPKSWEMNLPNKVKHKAIELVLFDKAQEGCVKIMDKLEFKSTKTKDLAVFREGLKSTGKTMFILAETNDNLARAGRNIPEVTVKLWSMVTIVDLLANAKIIMEEAAWPKLMPEADKA